MTVIVVLVALKVSGAVPVKLWIDTILPLFKPCGAVVITVAVLAASLAKLAVVRVEKAATDVVGFTEGKGNPS